MKGKSKVKADGFTPVLFPKSSSCNHVRRLRLIIGYSVQLHP